MDILITALLFVSFYLIRVVRLKRAVQLITLQSALMAVVCIVRTAPYSSWEHTLIAGGLTILVKVILIPGGIFRILRGLPPDNPLLGKRLIYGSLLCVAALALSYSLTGNILQNVEEKQMISASLFLILSGLIIIVMRSHAVMQIVGLLTMENGIYMLGMSITAGLPLIVELGVFLDVLIAVVVLVLLTQRMKMSHRTADTAVLSKLRG